MSSLSAGSDTWSTYDFVRAIASWSKRRAACRDPITNFNTLLVASDRPPSPDKLWRALPDVDPGVRPVLADTARRLEAPLPGGEVYTDDRAPVEWLIDRSIVAFAAGE